MLIIKTILSKCSSNENTLQTIFSNCNNLFCCTLWLSHAKPELLPPPPGHKGLLKLLLLMMLWSLILLQSFIVLLGILACLQESEILVLSHGVGYLHTVLIMGLLYVSPPSGICSCLKRKGQMPDKCWGRGKWSGLELTEPLLFLVQCFYKAVIHYNFYFNKK